MNNVFHHYHSPAPGLNVMIDLETLGTTAGSIILSIGATIFNETGVVIPSDRAFHVKIYRPSSEEVGLETDDATMQWWMNQSEDARSLLNDVNDPTKSFHLSEALSYFSTWLVFKQVAGAPIWANGAAFDFPILEAAYRVSGWDRLPWDFRAVRCYRTLKALLPHVKRPDREIRHDALEDAVIQAEHAALLIREISENCEPPQDIFNYS